MRKPESFGDYVQIMRKQRGLSGRDLAENIGVVISTIVRIEAGHVPKIDHFVKLVDALDLDAITAAKFLPSYLKLYEQILKSQKEANRE
jgi:transcriptional regulator with XRE-family HTH domain